MSVLAIEGRTLTQQLRNAEYVGVNSDQDMHQLRLRAVDLLHHSLNGLYMYQGFSVDPNNPTRFFEIPSVDTLMAIGPLFRQGYRIPNYALSICDKGDPLTKLTVVVPPVHLKNQEGPIVREISQGMDGVLASLSPVQIELLAYRVRAGKPLSKQNIRT